MYTVVIADDENIECISLKLLLTNEFPEVSVIETVENGIELIQTVLDYHPDIALVDVNMPGISGLEAIEFLRAKEGIATKFVILTAYDEFAYVKQALSLKVSDYILKPLKKDVITKTMKEVCCSIDEGRSNLERQRSNAAVAVRMDGVLEKEIIYSVLMGEPDMEDFSVFCEINHCKFSRGIFLMMIPEKKIGRLQEDLKMRVRGLIKQVLSNAAIYLFSMNDNNFYHIIFVPDHMTEEVIQDWIENIVSVLLNELQQRYGIVCRAGISSIQNEFPNMFVAYHEAKTSLEILLGQDMVFYPQIHTITENADAVDLRKSILAAKKATNSYVLAAVHFMQENYHRDISLEDIAEQTGISSFYLSRIFRQETGVKLTECLTGLRIEKAIILAKTTKMTISEIGKSVGYYNPTYFCRIFKKCTGKTIGQIREKGET